MKGFQVGVLIFFGVFVLIGVLIFSGAINLSKGGASGATTLSTIHIWGTVPKRDLAQAISFINNQGGTKIDYVEKDPTKYKEALLNAFAFGGLPDMFLMSQDLVYTYEDKVVLIPFTYFPERTWSDTYVRATDIFKRQDGILGFPIFSDPLVMYYNQDLLESAGFASVPKYWSDMAEYAPKLTDKNDALQISKSAVALGEFINVKNAKEIFSALLLQLNDSIVIRDTAKGGYATVLNQPSNVSSHPAVQSLKFYSEFSDSTKKVYSWNKSRKNSQADFVGGDLALYFGLASEYRTIKAKNPNLNFDVATIPQVKELKNTVTYADVYALAIPKTSPNANLALSMAANLANGVDTLALVSSSGYVPVRRDLIAGPRTVKQYDTFYNSALNARSWIDPNDMKSTELFTNMVESVSSGLSSPEDAVKNADTELKKLLLEK